MQIKKKKENLNWGMQVFRAVFGGGVHQGEELR